MNDLLKYAITILVASGASMIWGFSYRGNHPVGAVGAFFGAEDSTFTLAGWVAGLGVIGFLVGLALLIAGLVQQSRARTGAL